MCTGQRSISTNNTPRIGNKRQTKLMRANAHVYEDQNPLGKTIDQMCAEIDTTLTPEQQTYVNMLKKKISGGAQSQLVKCKPFTSDENCHVLAIRALCGCSSCQYTVLERDAPSHEFNLTQLEYDSAKAEHTT